MLRYHRPPTEVTRREARDAERLQEDAEDAPDDAEADDDEFRGGIDRDVRHGSGSPLDIAIAAMLVTGIGRGPVHHRFRRAREARLRTAAEAFAGRLDEQPWPGPPLSSGWSADARAPVA